MEPERVEMYNLSSAQGPRFAEIATEMTEKAKALGTEPLESMCVKKIVCNHFNEGES